MSAPRALVLRAAGTNCQDETLFALEQAGARPELRHVNELLAAPARLRDYRILVFPGGFSYGDDIAAGRVLAQEVSTRLADELHRYPAEGKAILGICNGFQVLVRAGLLPGFDRDADTQVASISFNDSNRFEMRWVRLRVRTDLSPFLEDGDVLECPVAHGEGKVVLASAEARDRLHAQRQVAFTYEPTDGSAGPAAYPDNPNGSTDGIAGICDPTGRIVGLMPHPDRNILPTHHPLWPRRGLEAEGDGVRMFRSMVRAVRADA